MTSYGKSLITTFIVPLAAFTLIAQVIIKRGDGTTLEAQPYLIPEVGAMVMADSGIVRVINVMPKEARPQAYKDVDLRADDIILMANAKRVSTTEELKHVYEAIAVGGELKLGITRDGESFIVSLLKGDPKSMPKMQIRIAGSDDTEPLPAVGVILKAGNGNVFISEKISDESSALANADVKVDDRITAMNDRPVTSLRQFVKTYESLPVGAIVEWKLRRGSRMFTVSFKKPQPKGMIIRREFKK